MKSGIWTFVMGFAAGTAAALLFAPHAGEETREILRDGARRGIDQGSKAVRDAAAKGAETVQRARKQAQDAIEAGKAAYSQAAE